MEITWEFLKDGTMRVKTPVWDEEDILPPYIADVFKTKEIIRTQDITQNGYSSITIPNLDKNNRWGHQIMVVQLLIPFFKVIKDRLEENLISVDEDEVKIASAVFATHDSGHTDNSHQSEQILKYSHEQRTIDILLGNTELGRLLTNNFPREKLERVVQIITNIDLRQGDVPKEELSPLLQLYTQLVSSGGDLDKVAYTMGDTTFAGTKSSLDPKKLLKSFDIDIDADGRYILLWTEEGQRQLEILDIERFQNYRDIYFNPPAEIMRYMEPYMLQLTDQESESVKQKLPSVFLSKIEASKSSTRITTLSEELQMTNTPMAMGWNILSKEAKNPILRYLSDFKNNMPDYHFLETQRDLSEILAHLQEIFPSRDLSNTNSLFDVVSKCKMIKPSEDPWIKTRNGDLQKASKKEGCLIKPENFVRRRIFFNPELLRLELDMSRDEFAKYQTDIDWFMDDLFQRDEEFMQKYILKDTSFTPQDFANFMQEQGFTFDGTRLEYNEDDYLDSKQFDLLSSQRDFRIRKNSTSSGSTKTYIDYKERIAQNKFTHTKSVKKSIPAETTVQSAKELMEENLDESLPVEDAPFMHVSTTRTNLLFRRNDKRFCVSWDNSTFDNKWLGQTADEVLLKISSVGENPDKLILKSVQQIMDKQSEHFEPYNDSTVKRGAYLTYKKLKEEREDLGIPSSSPTPSSNPPSNLDDVEDPDVV